VAGQAGVSTVPEGRRTGRDSGDQLIGEDVELLATNRSLEGPPYERLLGDAIHGETELFAREDAVEAEWRVVDPVVGDVTRCRSTNRVAGGRGRPTSPPAKRLVRPGPLGGPTGGRRLGVSVPACSTGQAAQARRAIAQDRRNHVSPAGRRGCRRFYFRRRRQPVQEDVVRNRLGMAAVAALVILLARLTLVARAAGSSPTAEGVGAATAQVTQPARRSEKSASTASVGPPGEMDGHMAAGYCRLQF
jgi:Glucose-6-phosphate dehydrogenase, C-terminal domain